MPTLNLERQVKIFTGTVTRALWLSALHTSWDYFLKNFAEEPLFIGKALYGGMSSVEKKKQMRKIDFLFFLCVARAEIV